MDIRESEEFQEMKEQLSKQLEDYKDALSTSTQKSQNLMLQVDKSEQSRVEVQNKLQEIANSANQITETHNDMTVVGEQLEELEVDEHTVEVFTALKNLHKHISGKKIF
jgi:uncharacterized coiled-coil DUF342 family protein